MFNFYAQMAFFEQKMVVSSYMQLMYVCIGTNRADQLHVQYITPYMQQATYILQTKNSQINGPFSHSWSQLLTMSSL